MNSFWGRIASRLVASKRLERRAKREFVRMTSGVERQGVNPDEILAWIQVIILLIDAVGPLVKKIRELVDAIRNRETPQAFAKRRGLKLG